MAQVPAGQAADFEDEFFGVAPPSTAALKPVAVSTADNDNSSDEDDENRCSEDEEKDEFEDL